MDGTPYDMLGNDEVGDCTLAGVVHLRQAVAAAHGETETLPSAAAVVAQYFRMTGGQDAGLPEADVLQTWQAAGLFGNKIDGYAPLDHRNPDELRSVIYAFGAAYLGVVIPATAQQQFAAGEPWDLTGTSEDRQIMGGHCVPAIGYDPDHLYVVTWGKTQQVTWRWASVYLEEAWSTLTSEIAAANGVDLDALQADLATLEGHAA